MTDRQREKFLDSTVADRADGPARHIFNGAPDRSALPLEPQNLKDNDYAELKRLIKQQGLLDTQLGYYAFKSVLNLILLAISVVLMMVVDNIWLHLLNAAYLAFVLVQMGFIGHDVGHQQVFRSARNNEIFSLVMSFVVGMSRSWWIEKHNQHHSNPNHLDLDPDIDIPILAFSEEQALSKRGFYKQVTRYQAFLFYPMLCLQGIGLRLASLLYIIRNKVKYPVAEPILMAAHLVIYGVVVIYLVGAWQGMLFSVVNQLAVGLYTGWTFAPNHKGMPVLDSESQLDFLTKQVITARNVKSSFINDFMYGGLNYQIEHHLFPSMPRNRLKEAQKIVRLYCQSRSVPIHETSVLQSQREILQYLHRVSAPLRVKRA